MDSFRNLVTSFNFSMILIIHFITRIMALSLLKFRKLFGIIRFIIYMNPINNPTPEIRIPEIKISEENNSITSSSFKLKFLAKYPICIRGTPTSIRNSDVFNI